MRMGIKLLLGILVLGRVIVGYIDPSSGGMLFQFLAVAFAILSTVVLFFSRQIKSFFARTARIIRERGSKKD